MSVGALPTRRQHENQSQCDAEPLPIPSSPVLLSATVIRMEHPPSHKFRPKLPLKMLVPPTTTHADSIGALEPSRMDAWVTVNAPEVRYSFFVISLPDVATSVPYAPDVATHLQTWWQLSWTRFAWGVVAVTGHTTPHICKSLCRGLQPRHQEFANLVGNVYIKPCFTRVIFSPTYSLTRRLTIIKLQYKFS
jgi:hypothetical protein